jgi:hypothetical protein
MEKGLNFAIGECLVWLDKIVYRTRLFLMQKRPARLKTAPNTLFGIREAARLRAERAYL